jgi:hypothetical protein
MTPERRTMKGSFLTTVTLLISIIALLLSLIAFQRTGGNDNMSLELKDLQAKIDKISSETVKRIDALREETAEIIEKVGKNAKRD